VRPFLLTNLKSELRIHNDKLIMHELAVLTAATPAF
jgi:hypothetical protein